MNEAQEREAAVELRDALEAANLLCECDDHRAQALRMLKKYIEAAEQRGRDSVEAHNRFCLEGGCEGIADPRHELQQQEGGARDGP